MLEVEIRYRYDDRERLIRRLMEWDAELAEDRTDVDQYFNSADRDFKKTDEAFRIRSTGSANCFTYKGPKRDLETKTRTEIEVPLGEGDEVATDARRLLLALGYKPVVVVRKQRQVYRFERGGFPMEACFDEVERVGPFLELEIMAEEEQYEASKACLLYTSPSPRD